MSKTCVFIGKVWSASRYFAREIYYQFMATYFTHRFVYKYFSERFDKLYHLPETDPNILKRCAASRLRAGTAVPVGGVVTASDSALDAVLVGSPTPAKYPKNPKRRSVVINTPNKEIDPNSKIAQYLELLRKDGVQIQIEE